MHSVRLYGRFREGMITETVGHTSTGGGYFSRRPRSNRFSRNWLIWVRVSLDGLSRRSASAMGPSSWARTSHAHLLRRIANRGRRENRNLTPPDCTSLRWGRRDRKSVVEGKGVDLGGRRI